MGTRAPKADPKDMIPSTATGRMRGYTEDLAKIEGLVNRTIRQIHTGLREAGKAPMELSFTVTRRTHLETRGWVVRRNVSQYEYEVRGPKGVVSGLLELIADMVDQI